MRGCFYKCLRENGTCPFTSDVYRYFCHAKGDRPNPYACAHRVYSPSIAAFVIGINPAPASCRRQPPAGRRESLDFSSIFIFLVNSVARRERRENTMLASCIAGRIAKTAKYRNGSEGAASALRHGIQWKFYPTEN